VEKNGNTPDEYASMLQGLQQVNGLSTFAYRISAKDPLDFATKALMLFKMKLKLQSGARAAKVQDRHIDLLAHYLVYGVSKKTREEYARSMHYGMGSINTMSSCLSKAGFLVNEKNRLALHPIMKSLSRFILQETGKHKGFFFLMDRERETLESGELKIEN
jgi:hypothetical protein